MQDGSVENARGRDAVLQSTVPCRQYEADASRLIWQVRCTESRSLRRADRLYEHAMSPRPSRSVSISQSCLVNARRPIAPRPHRSDPTLFRGPTVGRVALPA